jgi:hypothetical protein
MSTTTSVTTNNEGKIEETTVPLLCTHMNKRRQTRCRFKQKHGTLCGIHYRVQQRMKTENTDNGSGNNTPRKSKSEPLTREEILNWNPQMKITRIRLQNTLRNFGLRKRLHVTKDELIKRFKLTLYIPLTHEKKIIQIQRWFLHHVHRMMIDLHGGDPYRMKQKCVNDSEIMSLEDIQDVPVEQFICHTTADNHTYGFTTETIQTIFRQNFRPNNPYTRDPLPLSLGDRANALGIYYQNKNYNIPYPIMTRIQHYTLPYRVCRWCKNVEADSGFQIKPDWLLSMSPHRLQQSFRALQRIWSYLAYEVQQQIYVGNWRLGRTLFPFFVKQNYRRAQCRTDYIQIILSLFRKLTMTAKIRSDRERGAIITCAVLYITCRASRESLSWAADINFDSWMNSSRPTVTASGQAVSLT